MRQLVFFILAFFESWVSFADEDPKTKQEYQSWKKRHFDENGNDKRLSVFRETNNNQVNLTFQPIVRDHYCTELIDVLTSHRHSQCAPSEGELSINVFDFNTCKDRADCAKLAWFQYRKKFLLLMKQHPLEASKTPSGWHSDGNEVCVEREYLPSNILRSPYFEDATYCARWSQETFDMFEGGNHTDTAAWITLRVIVSVTQNPNSPYRQPNQQESARYGDAISLVYWKILEATCKELGWEFDFAANRRVRSCRAVVNAPKK